MATFNFDVATLKTPVVKVTVCPECEGEVCKYTTDLERMNPAKCLVAKIERDKERDLL